MNMFWGAIFKGKMEKTNMKGHWECQSSELIITDPSYSKDDAQEDNHGLMLGKRVRNAKQGTWTTELTIGEIAGWGERVMKMISFTNDEANGDSENFTLGVDSGQMSVFDWGYFPDGEFDDERFEIFYETCCDITATNFGDTYAGKGFVCRSGIGDGMYDTTVIRNLQGEAVRVEVNFMNHCLLSDN